MNFNPFDWHKLSIETKILSKVKPNYHHGIFETSLFGFAEVELIA